MKALTLLLLLTTTTALNAQKREYSDDAEVRAHLNLETKLSKKFILYLDQQYRFGDNVSYLVRGSADVGLVYKFNKHARIEGEYAYLYNRKNSGRYVNRHWFSGAISLRGDINRFKFIYRGMAQFRNGDVNSDRQNLTRIYNRNKVTARYEATKRFTFYVAGEIYIPLNHPTRAGTIERVRNSTGVMIKTFRNQELELYFMHQQRFHAGGWWDTDRYPSRYLERDWIYGIGYTIAI